VKLVILTNDCGDPIAINPANVETVEKCDTGTRVTMSDEQSIVVLNDFNATCEFLATEIKKSVPKILKAPARTAEEWQAEVDEVARQRDEYRKEAEALKLTGIGALHDDYDRAMEELCANDYRIGSLRDRVVTLIRAKDAAYEGYMRTTKERDEYEEKFEAAEYNLQLSVQGEEALSKTIENLNKQLIDMSKENDALHDTLLQKELLIVKLQDEHAKRVTVLNGEIDRYIKARDKWYQETLKLQKELNEEKARNATARQFMEAFDEFSKRQTAH
jgi:chromosome segregation ATPase